MKKSFIKIFGAAAFVAMAITSCSGGDESRKRYSDEESQEKTEEAAKATSDSIVDRTAVEAVPDVNDVTDDTSYRPGMKPEKLTFIDFNASWCVPCKKFEPVFKSAAATYKSDVNFVSIDIDNCPETAKAFGVEAVPTVVMIKPDGTVTKYVGTQDIMPSEKFTQLVEANR